MNKLQKEIFENNGKARIVRFFNVKTNKTIVYKVYNHKRKHIATTDDIDYARRVLYDTGIILA